MPVDNTKRLAELKAKAEKAQRDRVAAEATMKQLEKQAEDIKAEMAQWGVTEANAEAEMAKLETEEIIKLAEAEKLLVGATL